MIDSYDNPFPRRPQPPPPSAPPHPHPRLGRSGRRRAGLDCVVLDVSEGGASVVSVTGVDLPDTFELQLDARSKMGQAEVAWRDGAAVGVKLDKPK